MHLFDAEAGYSLHFEKKEEDTAIYFSILF
jgi:hypothetical protein